MNQIKSNTPNTPSLATRFVALAVKAAPWRRSAGLAALALVLGGIVSTAHASLLVYEPFSYSKGVNLNGWGFGTNGDIGFAGPWTAASTTTLNDFLVEDSTSQTLWNGTVNSVPHTGNFSGSPATPGIGGQNGNNPDHLRAWRPLDPNIITNFTLGSTNWMSFVQTPAFIANANGGGCCFAIGQGYFPAGDPAERGQSTGTNGPAVGIGYNITSRDFTASVWNPAISTQTGYHYVSSANFQVLINIAQIIWGDASNPTTVSVATFTDGTALNEAAFYSSTNLTTTSDYVDPTTFTNIALGGARYNVDELRIGTTFDDVIGIAPGAPGIYWAPTGQGGSGIWASGTNNWASIPNIVGALPQSTTNTLIFAGTNGTITVNGTVTVGAGLQFPVSGYRLVPGTSTPQISLTGADAVANTITVSTGTTTNSVQVIGIAGMTKAGAGTLILSNTGNTYSGGTLLDLGTLQIAALGSLGSGDVTFTGGSLQYPPGSGTSPIDVSGQIAPVVSGQVASIDPAGNNVTFNTGLSGNGGLTLLGSGSLTLAGANTYSGPTTVSAGTLNVSSASGVIATLNVPAGGTVNLGAGAVVTALNITGGTVNITGAGAQVGTLFVSSGAFANPSSYTLTVTNSANLLGVALSLSGASSFTLNGADLLNPTTLNHRVIAATGGTLTFFGAGLDAAIGIGNPGVPAVAATTTFEGNGVWIMTNGFASDNNNVYGKDNHAFHYIQVAAGDFDIQCQVTSATVGIAGLMARDNLVSEWTSHTGNYIGTWNSVGTSVTVNYETSQSAALPTSNWVAPVGINTSPTVNSWLEIMRTGAIIICNYSPDGVAWTQGQQVDYTASPWGPTTYLGLDLTSIPSSQYGGSGAFANVNFMGTAGAIDMSTTEIALSGGAQLNLGPTVTVAKVSTNGTALANGCWGSTASGAMHVDDTHFTGPGIAVISAAGPLTLTTPDITVTASDPYSYVVVNYPPLVVAGGTAPYTSTNYVPASGSAFTLGTNLITCTVTDSSCPSVHTAYTSFRVIVAPPAPVLDPRTGFSIQGGNPTFTFATFTSMYYRLVYTNNVTSPASAWLPVVNLGGNPPTDANGWIYASDTSLTLTDTNGLSGSRRFYRIEESPTGQ